MYDYVIGLSILLVKLNIIVVNFTSILFCQSSALKNKLKAMNKESWLSNYAASAGSKGSVETKDL